MIWLRACSEWRRRWPALAALTLLVALAGAVVLTATAGARRTRSTVDRADRTTRNGSAYAVLNDGRASLARAGAVARLPEVATGKRVALMRLFSNRGFAVAVAPIDPGFGSDLFRYRILRGRAPSPDRADEVALAETTARALRLDVGGTLELAAPTDAQFACLNETGAPTTGLCKTTVAAIDRDAPDLSVLRGVHVHLRVVGITRSLFDVGSTSNIVFFNVLPSGFFAEYRASIAWSPTVMVRYRPGVTDADFETALTKVAPRSSIVDTNTFTSVNDALRSTTGVLANGLLVFAAVATLVALVLVSQVLARNAERGVDERSVLHVFGVTRAGRALDATAPLLPVALAGAVLAVLGAWIGSYWMPIGTARRAEFTPGFDVDITVLAVGAVLIVLVVLVTSAAAAFWVARKRGPGAPVRPVRVPFGGVTASAAANMVSQVGRGRRAIPLRSAIGGTALAMAGVVSVAVFSGSLTRLTGDPVRQGWGWDVLIKGFNTSDKALMTNPNLAPERLRADRDVVAVTRVWSGYQPRINGHVVPGSAEEFVEGHRGVVIVSGREPEGADEVALGGKSLRRARVAIGGTVDVEGKRFRVVGTAVFPGTTNNDALADGALFSRAGSLAAHLPDLSGGSNGPDFPSLAVSFRPGADRVAAARRLTFLNNGDPPGTPVAHAEIEQLRQLDRLPVVLAGFLVVVALLAVGHLIVLAVRRRARDLAVLRTLGCTPGQTKRIVAWQATMLAIVGSVVGAPLGMLAGRLVWRRVANGYGVANDPSWPWLTVGLLLVGTLVLVNAIAWVPGRRAARRPVVEVLRTE